jgi:hypothetical protein
MPGPEHVDSALEIGPGTGWPPDNDNKTGCLADLKQTPLFCKVNTQSHKVNCPLPPAPPPPPPMMSEQQSTVVRVSSNKPAPSPCFFSEIHAATRALPRRKTQNPRAGSSPSFRSPSSHANSSSVSAKSTKPPPDSSPSVPPSSSPSLVHDLRVETSVRILHPQAIKSKPACAFFTQSAPTQWTRCDTEYGENEKFLLQLGIR